ncbi:MAG: zinc ribbon domain-containing protein [Deltaproteobacteria bacterium]
MPIYEFRCRLCGKVSEHLLFSSDTSPACPSCGAEGMEKLMSRTSSASGVSEGRIPGPKDTGCCGERPVSAPGCAGPGSCCGRHLH